MHPSAVWKKYMSKKTLLSFGIFGWWGVDATWKSSGVGSLMEGATDDAVGRYNDVTTDVGRWNEHTDQKCSCLFKTQGDKVGAKLWFTTSENGVKTGTEAKKNEVTCSEALKHDPESF